MTKFCKKCNAETERYQGGGCKPCQRKNSLDRYYSGGQPRIKLTEEQKKANRKALLLAYSLKNKERLKIVSKNWSIANKERRKEYEKTPGRKAKGASRYALNPEKAKAYKAVWAKAHPEAKRIHNNNRRALKAASGGKLSRGLSVKLFKLQRGKCPCCGFPLGDDYHLDHKMPVALEGSNTDDNMQLLRKTCNLNKSAKHPVDFMQERGFLL